MRRRVPPWGDEASESVLVVTGASPEVALEERLRGEQQARISARATPEGEALIDVTEPSRRRGRVPSHDLASTEPHAGGPEEPDEAVVDED